MGFKKTLASLVLIGAAALGGGEKTSAGTISLKATADNSCSMYIGDGNGVSEMFASIVNYGGRYIWSVDSISKENVAGGSYLYVFADSDYTGSDGLLIDLVTTSGHKVLGGSPYWSVAATGLGSRHGSSPSLSEMTSEIGRANSGSNPSNGWKPVTPCPFTNEEGGIGRMLYGDDTPVPVADIDPNSRWMWYDCGRDPKSSSPFISFNHDEWLIFRIDTSVPEPSTLALLGVSALALSKRKKR